MFARNGIAREEAEVHSKMNPRFAFDFINRRISLKSIHYRAVTGEIVSVDSGPLPSQGGEQCTIDENNRTNEYTTVTEGWLACLERETHTTEVVALEFTAN